MGNRRNISTSHGQIFDYWKNKYINKNGEVSDTYGEDSVQVVKDWAEPECWCCGDFCEEVYNYRDYDRDIIEDVKRVWNYGCVKSKLERCHIIPFSLGGTDEPDNLFLMCPTCHKESPDIIKPDLFFKWIYYKRSSGQLVFHGYDIKKITEHIIDLSKLYDKNIGEIDVEKLDSLLNRNSATTHGGVIAPATIAMSVLESMKDGKLTDETKGSDLMTREDMIDLIKAVDAWNELNEQIKKLTGGNGIRDKKYEALNCLYEIIKRNSRYPSESDNDTQMFRKIMQSTESNAEEKYEMLKV